MDQQAPDMAAKAPVLDRAFALGMSLLMILSALVTFAASPARVSAAEESCGVVPIDLVFVIDRSGSMNTSEGAHTRLGWAKLAATNLVDALNTPAGSVGTLHQVGVSTFGGTTTTRNIALGASNADAVKAAINGISGNGGTPFDIGMAEGADNMLDGDRSTYNGESVMQVLIFLSDGNPDPDSYTPNSGEISSYLASADKAYAVAIGPDGGNLGSGGTGVSYALMQQISKPGQFRSVTSASGLPNLFEEIYEEIACPVGSLEVRKALSPTDDPGRFDLWIDDDRLADEVGHNGSTGEVALLAGTYTVAESADGETDLADYTASISCVDTARQNAPVVALQGNGASWSVDVADGADVVCTIANERNTGTLIVNKVVINDDEGTAACDDFGFQVDGGDVIGFEADCGNAMVLPTGTYSVTEPAAEGYDTIYEGCSEIAVTAGGEAVCTITNDDRAVAALPSLVIDKAADVESIEISGPEDALVATPSIVTWTLTYTLTGGPVTNVVITDAIPEGFVFLDAANGGNFANGVVTWTFASLSESGSVSFRTTVDPETISRAAPTVNTATISSDQTPEDEGTDSVTVSVVPPPQGGNPTPTPAPSMPNTAIGVGPGGELVTVPVELLAVVFIGSLGALALANVKARGSRR